MTRRLAAASVVLAIVGLSIVVAPAADAVNAPTAAWWSRLATTDPLAEVPAALPVAPTSPDTIPAGASVPPGHLMVEGTPDGATAIAALRWQLAAGESGPSLTLPVAPGSSVNPESLVLACRTATPWAAPEPSPGTWDTKPLVDGSTCVNGIVADDLSTISFGLQPLVTGDELDIVLAPGSKPVVDVPAGAPEPPADIDGSTFRLLFEPPTGEALEVVEGSGFDQGAGDEFVTPTTQAPAVDEFGTSDGDFSPPAATDISTDLGDAPVAAPDLEPQDLAPSVPDVREAVPAAADSDPVDRTIGFVLLAVAGLMAAWAYWSSVSGAQDTAIGLGRFRTTLPAAAAVPVGLAGQERETVGGLSRFARSRSTPPTPLT